MPAPCSCCEVPVAAWDAADNDSAVCSFCAARSIVRVFPALFQRREEAAPAPAAGEGEAACFDHPGKLAVAHCSQCGRFVCRLCAVDFRGGTWCPECFAGGRTRALDAEFEHGRTLYDSLALGLATAPLLMWPVTFFTAPAAVFIAIRFWRRPHSLVRRRHWRSVLAILFASAQVGGWVWLVVYLVLLARARR
jgi:hypothetical protein